MSDAIAIAIAKNGIPQVRPYLGEVLQNQSVVEIRAFESEEQLQCDVLILRRHYLYLFNTENRLAVAKAVRWDGHTQARKHGESRSTTSHTHHTQHHVTHSTT